MKFYFESDIDVTDTVRSQAKSDSQKLFGTDQRVLSVAVTLSSSKNWFGRARTSACVCLRVTRSELVETIATRNAAPNAIRAALAKAQRTVQRVYRKRGNHIDRFDVAEVR